MHDDALEPVAISSPVASASQQGPSRWRAAASASAWAGRHRMPMNLLLDEEEPDDGLEAALSFLEQCASPGDEDEQPAPTDHGGDQGGMFVFGHRIAQEPTTGSSRRKTKTASAKIAKPRKASPSAPRKKPADYNPNRARDERRQELLHLRKKVLDLEEKLEEVKKNSENGSSLTMARAEEGASDARLRALGSSDASLAMQTACSTLSVWEDAAARQYAERHKAELENVRLKIILEGQIKVAKSLERLLKKRENVQLLQSCSEGLMRSKRMYQTNSDSDETELFKELLVGLDKAVLEVDAVFDANGLNRTERVFQDAKVRKNGANCVYLELFANKIMPFNMHATSSAVWQHFARSIERMPFRSYYQRQQKSMDTTEDMIVESFGVELHAKLTTVHILVRQIMRRFVEEDRILIAWRSWVDPVEVSSQPTSGIRFHEQGYIVIKQPQGLSSDFSLMQTCFIMTPDTYDNDPDHESKVGELSDFFVDCIARNICLSHQMIENCLMDQSLQQNNTPAARD